MSIHSTFRTFYWNKNILRQFLIIRNDKSKVTAFLKGSYNRIGSSFNYLNNLRFLTFSGWFFQKNNLYGIQMIGTIYLIFRNKQIFLPSIYLYKTKSTLITDKSTNNSLGIGIGSFRIKNRIFASLTDLYHVFCQQLF